MLIVMLLPTEIILSPSMSPPQFRDVQLVANTLSRLTLPALVTATRRSRPSFVTAGPIPVANDGAGEALGVSVTAAFLIASGAGFCCGNFAATSRGVSMP